MQKIVHIINGLDSGGAENMLYKFLKYSNKKEYIHEVISLLDEGYYGDKIEKLGIRVHCLNINKKNIFKSIIESRQICKDSDVINTWLYNSDIYGFFLGKILLRKKLIWNIRHSNLEKNANKPRTLKIVKINAFLSKYVDSITFNSRKALEMHKKVGFKDINSIVIANGFESDKFKYNIDDRIRLRQDLGILKKDKVIITVGRWNIQKDYYTLLRSLKELKKMTSKFKMIMVGKNLDKSNHELMNLVESYGLKNNMILLGKRYDIPELLSAADVYVSSSLGESFSNSIGEAMACELHCIVTNVGDSKIIIGDTGQIVEPGDYKSLSRKMLSYIEKEDLGRNIKARDRIIDNYFIKNIVEEINENINNCF